MPAASVLHAGEACSHQVTCPWCARQPDIPRERTCPQRVGRLESSDLSQPGHLSLQASNADRAHNHLELAVTNTPVAEVSLYSSVIASVCVSLALTRELSAIVICKETRATCSRCFNIVRSQFTCRMSRATSFSQGTTVEILTI